MRRTIEPFEDIPGESWELLEPIFTEENIPRGSYFSRIGSDKQKLALVLEGTFRQFHLSEEGEEYNLGFYITGDFLCSGMGHEVISTTAFQALEKSSILSASFEAFSRIAQNSPGVEEIHKNFLYQLVQKQRQKDIVLLKASGRERYQWFLQHYKGLLDKIPHYHIASFLGMTPTQLSRVRKIHQQM